MNEENDLFELANKNAKAIISVDTKATIARLALVKKETEKFFWNEWVRIGYLPEELFTCPKDVKLKKWRRDKIFTFDKMEKKAAELFLDKNFATQQTAASVTC